MYTQESVDEALATVKNDQHRDELGKIMGIFVSASKEAHEQTDGLLSTEEVVALKREKREAERHLEKLQARYWHLDKKTRKLEIEFENALISGDGDKAADCGRDLADVVPYLRAVDKQRGVTKESLEELRNREVDYNLAVMQADWNTFGKVMQAGSEYMGAGTKAEGERLKKEMGDINDTLGLGLDVPE